MPHITGCHGIQWEYTCEGTGPQVLFLHGWGVDRRIWRQQAKYFSETHTVLSLDLPGHGGSTWIESDLDMIARDMHSVLKELGGNQMSVVGSSLGGLFALKLYDVAPEIIHSMVFVGSMPRFKKSSDYPYGLDVKFMRKLGGQVEDSYPSIVNIFFRSLFTRSERKTRRYKWLQKFRQFDGVPMQQALTAYLSILENEDLRDVLKSVRCPIQFINGTGDEICDHRTVDYLKTLRPDARFDDFHDCGHFPFLINPYTFNTVLMDFLSGHNGSSSVGGGLA